MTRYSLAITTALAVVLAATASQAAQQPDPVDAADVWVEPAMIALGDTLSGTLADGDSRTGADGLMDRYVMDLEAGTRVELTLRSDAFDTYLIAGIVRPDGFEQIAQDDDGLGEGLNSRLRFTAAETGRYEIRARGFAAMGEGDYTLTTAARTDVMTGQPAGSIAYGGQARGTLSPDDTPVEWAEEFRYDAYRFQARAGDRLEAALRSDDFDTTLMLMSESRWGVVEQLAFDDDGLGEGTNSRLIFFAPEDGEYALWASSYGPEEAGAYSLTLTQLRPLPTPTPIAVGETLSGLLETADPVGDTGGPYDAFVLHAEAGQRLEIASDSTSFPTTLGIGQAVGIGGWEALAYGDNYAGDRTSSRILFSPSSSGDYIVRVIGVEAAMRGDYTVTVRDRGPLPPPPPPGSIRVGDSLTGWLQEGDGVNVDEKYFDEYDVHTQAGQRLSLTVRSDAFDTYLEVYRRQPDGTFAEVMSDDDSGGDLDSRGLLRAEGGDYRVRVTSFGMGEVGDYTLAIRDLGTVARPASLTWGRTVSGQIDDNDALSESETRYDSYRFRLNEGERAQFIARSEAFDTLLIAAREGPDGFEIVTYDDDGMGDGTTNSRMVITADQTGDYELWVMPLDPATSGAYTVTGRELGPSPEPRPIAPGETIEGSLQDGDGVAYEGMTYDGYRFEGQAGQRIRVDMNSTAFDTFLLVGVHGPGGLTAIAENDDSGAGTDSSVMLTLPSDARYEIWATSYAVGETGDYSLLLTDMGPEPEPGSLLIGSTIRGALSENDPMAVDGIYYDAYRFSAEAGRAVRITATSNAIDSYLQLGQMEGRVFNVLQEDDDGLSDLNSLITFTPETDGTYVVRVRSYGAGEVGDYVLTVEDATAE